MKFEVSVERQFSWRQTNRPAGRLTLPSSVVLLSVFRLRGVEGSISTFSSGQDRNPGFSILELPDLVEFLGCHLFQHSSHQAP